MNKQTSKPRKLNVALLLFAAGESRRLGKPKQLIKIKGKYLLQRIIDEVIDDQYDIFLVTGAYRDEIIERINTYTITEIYNDSWENGFGNSISKAMMYVTETHNYDAVIISVADQVYLSKETIQKLVHSWDFHINRIVVSDYGMDSGPPVLFPKKYFDDLKLLDGDKGAKGIIYNNKDQVVYIPFPEGRVDIDQQNDIDHLKLKRL